MRHEPPDPGSPPVDLGEVAFTFADADDVQEIQRVGSQLRAGRVTRWFGQCHQAQDGP